LTAGVWRQRGAFSGLANRRKRAGEADGEKRGDGPRKRTERKREWAKEEDGEKEGMGQGRGRQAAHAAGRSVKSQERAKEAGV